jgi:phosphorylcholine metabolism protein LicD
MEDNQWKRTPNRDFFLDRNKNKLNTILSINLWTKRSQQKAIDIIRYLFNLAKELKFPIFLSDGTLLGLVRHGSMMGWDDDIDLSLDQKDLNSLIRKIEQDDIYRITKHYWKNDSVIYYKVWDKNNTNIPGYPYSFPFVDIWIYDNNKQLIDFFYYEPLPYKLIFPLAKALFYDIQVYIPNQSLIYLDKLYANWRTNIQIFQWRHQTETASNLPLQAIIETDSNGFILSKSNS